MDYTTDTKGKESLSPGMVDSDNDSTNRLMDNAKDFVQLMTSTRCTPKFEEGLHPPGGCIDIAGQDSSTQAANLKAPGREDFGGHMFTKEEFVKYVLLVRGGEIQRTFALNIQNEQDRQKA